MAIIGLSGHKQSGKDTVAKIIQYLLLKNSSFEQGFKIMDKGFSNSSPTFSLDIFSRWGNQDRANYSGWQTKSFADKLKDIVCLLLNCTREQLENNEFKSSKLNSDWDNSHGIDTVRELLQIIGTDCGREMIHPDLWVISLMSEYKLQFNQYVGENEGYNTYPNWIITDVRFPNEAEAIRDKGGLLFRIDREGLNSTDTHKSETALDNYLQFTDYIRNYGTIEDLVIEVKNVLEAHKIINP